MGLALGAGAGAGAAHGNSKDEDRPMTSSTDRNTPKTPAEHRAELNKRARTLADRPWSHSQQHEDDAKHAAEHRKQQAQDEAHAKRRDAARVFLVIDASDPLDPPCSATAWEAADALQMDVDAVLWAIEEHGRCDDGTRICVSLVGWNPTSA